MCRGLSSGNSYWINACLTSLDHNLNANVTQIVRINLTEDLETVEASFTTDYKVLARLRIQP